MLLFEVSTDPSFPQYNYVSVMLQCLCTFIRSEEHLHYGSASDYCGCFLCDGLTYEKQEVNAESVGYYQINVLFPPSFYSIYIGKKTANAKQFVWKRFLQ